MQLTGVASFLSQNHTWAPFNLSSRALIQIMVMTDACVGFLNIFKGFGRPTNEYEPDFSGGYALHVDGTPGQGMEGFHY